MADKLKIPNGCLEVGEQDTDFLIEGEVELPPLVNQDNVRIETNQGNSLDCTLYSPIGCIQDLFNVEFSPENIGLIVDQSYQRGRQRGKGWSTQLGVKNVCDWWNDHNDNKVIFYRIEIKSLNFEDALKKGYTVVVTYRGNGVYGQDVWDDAIVQGVDFKPPTYGHCTSSISLDGTKVMVKDSYKGRKGRGGISTNIYELSDIKKLVDNGVYYPMAYLILPEITKTKEDIKRLKEMETMINQNIENNSKLWFMSNDPLYKDWLTECNNRLGDKLNDIKIELKKL